MAMADYRLCDVCGSKVFYDSNLNYQMGPKDYYGDIIPEEELARTCGEKPAWGYKLDYLGDWAVICADCAKTHKTIVVPLAPPQPSEPEEV